MSALKRPLHPMPDYVLAALEQEHVMDAYHQRPPYQQNDYVGWISRARRMETRLKRMHQMIEELKNGNKYMGMDYKPRKG